MCDNEENVLHVQGNEKGKKPDAEGGNARTLQAALPYGQLLSPRQIKAHEKKYNDNNSPLIEDRVKTKVKNGLSPSSSIPSPRELKAYEKHIRNMRERLSKVGG